MEDAKRRPGPSNFASACGTPPSDCSRDESSDRATVLALETFDAFPVGAAPLLIDDAWTASPELALVDPELADRLRSALAGPERWEARAEPEDGPPGLAAVVAHEELSLSESAPPPADVDELEDVEHESSEETESFAAAHPTLPVSAEPEANHEIDAFLRNIEASPERADPPLDDLADLIVYDSTLPAEDDRVEPAETDADDMSEAQPVNDYPALPTSGELDATIEATDATLRRMREHLTSDEPTRRPRRVGRFVTVSAGICAVGAVAVLAADTQLGLATLPGMLGF
jgi:hypothetical protein